MTAIGTWFSRRTSSNLRIGRTHLVESEIADRLVMRCGREMKKATKGGELVEANGTVWNTCLQCWYGPAPSKATD